MTVKKRVHEMRDTSELKQTFRFLNRTLMYPQKLVYNENDNVLLGLILQDILIY